MIYIFELHNNHKTYFKITNLNGISSAWENSITNAICAFKIKLEKNNRNPFMIYNSTEDYERYQKKINPDSIVRLIYKTFDVKTLREEKPEYFLWK